MEKQKETVKPTLIIKQPEYSIGVNGRPCLLYTCNDGREYVSSELAAIIGIGRDMLSKRCGTYGWWSEKVFQTPDLAKMEKVAATRARKLQEVAANDGGNAEWAKMGKTLRNQALQRLPRPGIYERSMEVGHGR